MKQYTFLETASLKENKKYLITQKEGKNGMISHYQIAEKDEPHIKRAAGDYFTIQFTDQILKENASLIQKELKKILKSFLKKYHKNKPILVVGLGNSGLKVDAFGSLVTDQMIATNQYNDFLTVPKVALFNPEVISKTGISSFKLIELVVHDLKPDLIIMIDSLATKEISSLNRLIEISDTGIIPGSALRTNKEIKRCTFQIPILSIGIPFLYQNKKMLLSSAFLDQEVTQLSKLVAQSLNESILF